MPTNRSGVTVTVPASANSARVLRAVVGSVAAGLDFTYDEIDDLRLALNEAFSQLLTTAPDATSVVVRLAGDDGAIEVTVSCDADVDPWPPHGAVGELTWHVLSALADEASFEHLDEGPAIRFAKRPATR